MTTDKDDEQQLWVWLFGLYWTIGLLVGLLRIIGVVD